MESRTKDILTTVFHGLIALVSFVGVLIQSQIFTGRFYTDIFSFFTIWTNIAVVVIYGMILYRDICKLAGKPERGVEVSMLFRGGLLLSILVVCLVYAFMLAPELASNASIQYEVFSFSDILVHFVAPILVLLDYIFFTKKGNVLWYYSLAWLVYPVVYCVVAIMRGLLGGEIEGLGSSFPYYFLDVGVLGWGNVLLVVVALAAMFVGLGFIIYILDSINYPAWKQKFKNYRAGKGFRVDANFEEQNKVADVEAKKTKPSPKEEQKCETKEITTSSGTYLNPYLKKKTTKKKAVEEDEQDDRAA